MSESEEKKPSVRTYIFVTLYIIGVVRLIIWGLFFSHNIYIILITIGFCVIAGIFSFFEQLYKASSYYYKKKYTKKTQQKIELPITQDDRKELICSKCGIKTFSVDAQFYPNCGHNFENDYHK